MNSALRGTAANVEAWERWPTDKTVQRLGDGSGDKAAFSLFHVNVSGDTLFIGLALSGLLHLLSCACCDSGAESSGHGWQDEDGFMMVCSFLEC